MKLVLKVDNNKLDLTPRDIRNFLASINEKEDYVEKILWHKHIPPPLIYRKPTKPKNNQPIHIEIINYENDVEMMDYLRRKAKNKEIYNKSGLGIVISTKVRNENFTIPKKAVGIVSYYTRTPIIISSNDEELKKVREIEDDSEKLREFVKKFIVDSVKFATKYYTDVDLSNENIIIDIAEMRYFYVEYPKEDRRLFFPAVKCRILSSHILPHFVGYRTSYSFGELVVA